jgi:two-component system, cell cycle sensor histidine kinase and response regulator CckA
MNLQRKILAITLLSVGAATALTAAEAYFALNRVASTFETQATLQDGTQLSRWFDQDLRQLSELAHSHSLLPQVLSALRSEDDTYAVYSLSKENVEGLRLKEVWLLDAKVPGKIPLRFFADPADSPIGDGLAPPEDRLLQWSELARSILDEQKQVGSLSTVTIWNDQAYLLAAHPVREGTLLNSPPIGVLMMVRQIDHNLLSRLSETLAMPVGLDVGPAVADKLTFLPQTSTRAQLLIPLYNAGGQVVANLSASVPRDIYQSIASFVRGAVGVMVTLGLFLGLGLVLVLNRLVLKRVARVNTQLASVRLNQLNDRDAVNLDGDDELTSLASSINHLLHRIRSDMNAQQQAAQRHETLQLQLMQSQKMEAIGRFSGGVAHDFNNSLIGTKGWIQVALEDLPLEHPSRQALEQALKGSEYASSLVRQLMSFSRQSPPRLDRVHMAELVEKTRAFVAAGLIKRTKLEFHWHGGLDTVLADPMQLQQVLVNLLINASDAMQGEGRVRLLMYAITLTDDAPVPGGAGLVPGPYLHLQVCDEGSGIPREYLDQIFEPFFTTKAEGRGTGLGLSVAHGILTRHRGGIGVESEPDKGTRFHLLIPAADDDSSSSSQINPSG